MLRHAARAVPWPLVAIAAGLVLGLLAAVRYDSWTLWPRQGTAVGLLAAAAVAAAWVTWRRTLGEATPGQRWAIAVAPAFTAWALVRPFERQVPVFPYAFGGAYGDWTASGRGWTVVGAIAAAALALVRVRDGRPWRRS